MPRSLDLARLSAFEVDEMETAPAPAIAVSQPSSNTQTYGASWPSREPLRDGQISIKAPLDVIDRFRLLCREDRRTYADMLAILMDAFQAPGGRR